MKLLERFRAPFTENEPEPPMPKRDDATPGSVRARATGLRLEMGSSVACVVLIVPPRTGDSVCSWTASAETSTTLDWVPTSSFKSNAAILPPETSKESVFAPLKPGEETVSSYVPGSTASKR